jgi:cytochrome c oxidase assembly factor CtaG
MDNKKVVAAILIIIPFVAYFILPAYNAQYPEAFGLPLFYWYQIIWLPISGIMFYIAAVLIDMGRKRTAPSQPGVHRRRRRKSSKR